MKQATAAKTIMGLDVGTSRIVEVVSGHATAPAVGPAGLGRTAARHGLHEGQPADQRHHGGVDLA